MKFIADYYRPDIVLLPIGGNFTMDPKDAAFATREWIASEIERWRPVVKAGNVKPG